MASLALRWPAAALVLAAAPAAAQDPPPPAAYPAPPAVAPPAVVPAAPPVLAPAYVPVPQPPAYAAPPPAYAPPPPGYAPAPPGYAPAPWTAVPYAAPPPAWPTQPVPRATELRSPLAVVFGSMLLPAGLIFVTIGAVGLRTGTQSCTFAGDLYQCTTPRPDATSIGLTVAGLSSIVASIPLLVYGAGRVPVGGASGSTRSAPALAAASALLGGYAF